MKLVFFKPKVARGDRKEQSENILCRLHWSQVTGNSDKAS